MKVPCSRTVTIYAHEVFQKLHINIPRKVALVGFDNFELAATLRPSISVVRQPSEDVGRIAAELSSINSATAIEANLATTPSRNISSWKINWCCATPAVATS